MTRDFFNDGAFNHNDQFVALFHFQSCFIFQGKRLKPFFNETGRPRPSFACVSFSTPMEELIIMGFLGPQRRAQLILHSTFHMLIPAFFY